MNRPQLCPHVTWNKNASTLIDLTSDFSAFAIDSKDQIYLTDRETNQLSIYPPSGVFLTQINSSRPTSVFVHEDKYILIGSNRSIDLFLPSGESPSLSLNVSEPCRGLFVDRDQTVYCSLAEQHRVITLSPRNPSSPEQYSVGTGSCGSTSRELCFPMGLYVSNEFDLYVADSNNNRIQRFRNRSSVGETVVGTSGGIEIDLSRPTALISDVDGTLFILDSGHHRIVHYFGSGWRCVVGCTSTENESLTGELPSPSHLAFDQQGNLLVLDQGNRRLQKYPLMKERNTCCKRNSCLYFWEME